MTGIDPHGTDQASIMARWERLFGTLDLDTFIADCEAAYAREPEDLGMAAQWAAALGHQDRRAEKQALLRALLQREPNSVQINTTLGLEMLTDGKYRAGWPHFAYRLGKEKTQRGIERQDPARRWRGEALPGKRVMLLCEQGLGDSLQFLRFSASMRAERAEPWLDVQKPLRALLAESPATGRVMQPGRAINLHHWIPVMDLLPVFAPTRDDLVWPGRYVAPPSRPGPMARLPHARLRVGLAWRGNPKFQMNAIRSTTLAGLARLRDAEGCRFFSLLPKDNSDELEEADWVTDLSAVTSPFENLAYAIDAMDVVVSVCTSIAHLAGAMGKPTLLLLSTMPDWRWGTHGTTTPWYPSMTLIRQSRFADWAPVVEQTAKQLTKF